MNPNDQPKFIIAVDAMGGDYAPQSPVLGAVEAAKEDPSLEILLVGRTKEIKDVLQSNNLSFDENRIIEAEEVITMSDHPANAHREKPKSSIVIGLNLVKEKKAAAFVSAGNTGAMMSVSTLILGRLHGVSRPSIGTLLPSEKGFTAIYDAGANVDSKPQYLFEYAIMGSIFMEEIFGIKNPKVGVLSVGEEEEKGNQLSKAAFNLIKESKLNFIGNVEGRDILKGKADVVVCDGFVGNVILKFAEGLVGLLRSKVKDFAGTGFINTIRVLLMKGTLKKVMKQFDYQTYGGVPLLGVNGISIIGHGSSTPLAIKNMIFRAKEMSQKDLVSKIERSLKDFSTTNK